MLTLQHTVPGGGTTPTRHYTQDIVAYPQARAPLHAPLCKGKAGCERGRHCVTTNVTAYPGPSIYVRCAGVQEIPADNVQLAPPNTEHREDTLSGAALLGLRDPLRRTGLGTTAVRRLGARVGFADLLEGE